MQKAAPRAQSTSTRDRWKVVALMCVALALFSCLDASAKFLATTSGLPVAQVVWVRFAGQTALMLMIVGLANLPSLFATRRLGHQLVRSFLMAATTACNFLALEHLRLDQTVTIVFLAPLVVALLAGPLLGEWVGWRRLLAIFVGFLGVLIAVHPGTEGLDFAVLFSFGAMLAYALFILMTRYLTAFDPPMVTLFYAMLAGTLLGAPFAIANWAWPAGATDWVLLALLGAFGGLGHYLFILAYRLAPASFVSPLIYLQLPAMAGLGYLAFGDVPDAWTLLGAAVIVGSGVYLFHRERKTAGEQG